MKTIYLTEPVYLLVDLVESINSYVFLDLQTSAVQSTTQTYTHPTTRL